MTDTDRNSRIATILRAAELKRIAEARKARLRADRLWTMRRQISGLKQPKNRLIVINVGVDCYA